MDTESIRVKCAGLSPKKRSPVPEKFMGVVGQLSPAIKNIVVSLGYLSDLENAPGRIKDCDDELCRRAELLKMGDTSMKRFAETLNLRKSSEGGGETRRQTEYSFRKSIARPEDLDDQISFTPSPAAWTALLQEEDPKALEENFVTLADDLGNSCENGAVAATDLTTEITVVLMLMNNHRQNALIQQGGCKLLNTFLISNPEHCWPILLKGGVVIVTAGMKAHLQSLEIQIQGCGVLQSLSASNAHKELVSQDPNIVMAEGIRAVIGAVTSHQTNLALTGLGLSSLQNMSFNEKSSAYIADNGGIECILNAMKVHMSSAEVQVPACWSLLNVSVNNLEIKRLIASWKGIELLLQTMKTHTKNAAVQVPASSALHSLVTKNQENKICAAELEAVEVLLMVINEHWSSAQVVRPAVWAMQTLSSDNRANTTRMVQAGAIPVVLQLIYCCAHISDIFQPACWALESIAMDPQHVKLVRNDDAFAPAFSVLQNFCRAAGPAHPTSVLTKRLDPLTNVDHVVIEVASVPKSQSSKPTSVFL